ncbi:MAG: TetR/AcrR family transcriptional regulator [Chloroflexi bacterium]|nr:TetR/AcrR family transcriptional regulator [Chloroflexota bacterium]
MATTDIATRPRLDRREVLEAALALVDRDGLEALSLRRLGAELGVDPMAIYRHVEGRDGLELGLAELLWDEVARPEAGEGPPDALRRLAHSLRDLFRRHPAAAPLVLRCASLPRSELELFRAYLDALMAGGLAEPATVLRPVVAYALGSGYTESAMLSVQCAPAARQAMSEREVLLALGQALPAGTPPELALAAVALIADCNPERCFEDGLDLMLAGLEAGRAHRPDA